MLAHLLLLPPPIPIPASSEPNLQICPRAKDAPRPRDHDAPDALVPIEQLVHGHHLRHHGVGEGIVLVGAVQREDDDAGVWGVVLGADLRPGEGVVGGGEGRGRHLERGMMDWVVWLCWEECWWWEGGGGAGEWDLEVLFLWLYGDGGCGEVLGVRGLHCCSWDG